jgi:4-hydroxy-4-methyl-2-oxoglutarate aldolase
MLQRLAVSEDASEYTVGVAVIALAKAEEIVELAREQAEREQKTREWVAKGKTIEDLLKEFGRI